MQTRSNPIVSRYVLLLIDTILAVISFTIAFGLQFNFDLKAVDGPYFLDFLLLTVGIRFGCFLLIGTYQSTIRHTSLEDVTLLAYAVTLSAVAAALVSFLNFSGGLQIYVPFSILLIDYFCCLVLLSLSRFGMKAAYWKLFPANNASRERVLIYGAGKTGLVTRRALAQSNTHNYQILAFIDDNPAMIGTVIEGVKVVSRQQAYQRYVQHQDWTPQVILAMETVSAKKRAEIVDFFIKYHVPVRTVPGVEQWMQGQLSTSNLRDVGVEELLEREPIQLTNNAIGSHLEDQVIMITGAAGSIGSELVAQILNHKPHTIVLVDQAESALIDLELQLRQEHKAALIRTHLLVKIADVSDEVRMQHIFRTVEPTMVFHAATYKHVALMEEHPYEAVRANVLGTQIVADLSLKYGVETFVLISTDKAVNPTNVMGATKRLAEMYVQGLNQTDPMLRQTRFIVARLSNLLGMNSSVVSLFRQQIQNGGPVTVTHPDITRYFMTIPEASQLVLEAAVMGHGGEVFVFDTGRPMRIVDLARKLIRLSGQSSGQEIRIVYTGLRPGEKLYEELLHTSEQTLPTHHPKVMIARMVVPQKEHIERVVEHLRRLLPKDDDRALVASIKKLIPEYISNNSVYATLDH